MLNAHNIYVLFEVMIWMGRERQVDLKKGILVNAQIYHSKEVHLHIQCRQKQTFISQHKTINDIIISIWTSSNVIKSFECRF